MSYLPSLPPDATLPPTALQAVLALRAIARTIRYGSCQGGRG
ncbi:hypothetical protein AB0E63_33510 [Kribbella sp. NPDC026596]